MPDKASLLKKLKKYNPKVLEEPSVIAKAINKKWDLEILMEHLDFEDLMFVPEWNLKDYEGIFCLEYENYVCWREDQLHKWV